MKRDQMREFVEEWIRLWNARDLPAILSHYDDRIVFHSPKAEAGIPRWPLQNPPPVAGSKSPRRQQENNLLTIHSEIHAYSFFIL